MSNTHNMVMLVILFVISLVMNYILLFSIHDNNNQILEQDLAYKLILKENEGYQLLETRVNTIIELCEKNLPRSKHCELTAKIKDE